MHVTLTTSLNVVAIEGLPYIVGYPFPSDQYMIHPASSIFLPPALSTDLLYLFPSLYLCLVASFCEQRISVQICP
jgi:hypothetical protein